jgi:hypothetical protein
MFGVTASYRAMPRLVYWPAAFGANEDERLMTIS